MTPKKTTPEPSGRPNGRKRWQKKSPVEVIYEQADKLRAEIEKDEAALEAKRRQLEKFEQAVALFEQEG